MTPFAARYLATSVPSLAMERAMKPPPGQTTMAVPFLRFRGRLENGEGWLGDVGDDFGVPDFREVFFFGIGFWCGAGRRALIEGNDVLGEGAGGGKEDVAQRVRKDLGFHGRIV